MALASEQRFEVPTPTVFTHRFRSLRSPAVITLGSYLALAFALLARAWLEPGSTLAGTVDAQSFVWTFRWVPFALSHGLNPLITNYLDYPGGMNLMWNANALLLGLLMSPVTLLLNVAVAYNLAATLAPALSAWCAFFAIRRYVSRWPLAAIAGMLYGFAPGMIAQESFGHLHLTFAVFAPLVLLIADEIAIRRRLQPLMGGVVLGLLAGLQLLIGEELMLLTAISGGLTVLVAGVEMQRAVLPYLRSGLRAAGAAAVVFLLLASFPLAEQFFGPQHVQGALQPSNFYVSDLLNFVIPSHLQLFSPAAISWLSSHFTGDASSRDAYLGLPLLAFLVILARRHWGDRIVRWSALVAAILAVLSLGPALHVAGVVTRIPLPWALLQGLHGFNNVLPGRFMLIAMLPAALLLARGLDRDLDTVRAPSTLLPALIGLLVLIPNLEPVTSPVLPTFFIGSAIQRISQGEVALVAPFSDVYSSDAMYWQAAARMHFRMPEGGGVIPGPRPNPPPSWMQQVMVQIELDGTEPALTPTLLTDLRQELREWRVQTIVAGPMPHHDVMISLLSAVMGRSPERVDGVDVWWHVLSTIP